MSAVETTREETELGGSVKLILNAKGEVQIETKARVGDEPGALQAAADEAQKVFDALRQRYPR